MAIEAITMTGPADAVSDDRQDTRVFYCIDHLMAALRQGLVLLRTVSTEA